jgi:hypothetical protein
MDAPINLIEYRAAKVARVVSARRRELTPEQLEDLHARFRSVEKAATGLERFFLILAVVSCALVSVAFIGAAISSITN